MIEVTVCILFVLFGLLSLGSYDNYNFIVINNLLELFLFLVLAVSTIRLSMYSSIILVTSLGYFILCYIYACVFGDVHSRDFILAYKVFIYIPILCILSNVKLISSNYLSFIFKFILGLFLVKYILWWGISDSTRPGVFTENNFELPMLLIISLTYHFKYKELSRYHYFILIVIFLLSGSRSGLVTLVFSLFFMNSAKLDFKNLIRLCSLALLGLGVASVFISRMGGGGLESIDRFLFLQNFLYEIEDWSFINYLFGSEPLTSLSATTCSNLVYYQSLFSRLKEGVCYSVVFHSFTLRLIFDHGILGFLFIFISIYKLLKLSKITIRFNFIVLGVVFLNSLSVSALNSVYMMVGLLVVMTSQDYNKQSLKVN